MQMSNRLADVKPSLTFAILTRAKELRAAGKDVLGLAAGEPDFPPPSAVNEAAHAAIDAGRGRYTPVAGLPALRDEIARSTSADTGLEINPASVVVSSGAKQALFNALYVLCDPGDEVIIPVPYWTSYPEMARALGIVPVFWRPGDDGLSLDDLDELLTSRTRVVMLNSPSNPTGNLLPRALLEGIAERLREREVWILSDDIYEKLVFDDGAFVNLPMVAPDLLDRTILVNGMSKTYCMTGWRLGYSIAHPDVARQIATVQGHTTSCANAIAQEAATAALKAADSAAVRAMVEEYRARASYVHGRLDAIGGVTCPEPEGAFYLFPRFDAWFGRSRGGVAIDSGFSLSSALLDEASVAVVPGEAFGDARCVRISYATSRDVLEQAMDRLDAFFGNGWD